MGKTRTTITYTDLFMKCGWCGSCSYSDDKGINLPCYCRKIGPFNFIVPKWHWRWDSWKGIVVLWGIGFRDHRRNFHWRIGMAI